MRYLSNPDSIPTCTATVLACVVVLSALSGCESRVPDSPAPPTTRLDSSESEAQSRQLSAESVELALNWFPEAEHGGYYAALVHGFFQEAGLNVKITPGGPNAPVIQNVASGRVMFGIANADQVLVGRAREADVVAIFAPLQTSPRSIMVHEKSGIRTFADLKNVTLAINANATFAAYLRKQIPLEGCTIVPYSGDVAQFLLHDDFAQQAYVFSEPFVARKKGAQPHNLLVADLGFNPYTSVLIVSDTTVRERPDTVGRFVQACQRGWNKYLVDPEAAHKHIHEQNQEMKLDVLEFGVQEIRKLCLTETVSEANIGSMTPERWQTLVEQLIASDVIEAGSVNSSEAFTTEFLATSLENAE